MSHVRTPNAGEKRDKVSSYIPYDKQSSLTQAKTWKITASETLPWPAFFLHNFIYSPFSTTCSCTWKDGKHFSDGRKIDDNMNFLLVKRCDEKDYSPPFTFVLFDGMKIEWERKGQHEGRGRVGQCYHQSFEIISKVARIRHFNLRGITISLSMGFPSEVILYAARAISLLLFSYMLPLITTPWIL